MNKGLAAGQTLIVAFALTFAIAPLAAAGQAGPRWHLITFNDVVGARSITDSGVILAGNKVVKPDRDAAGSPVWDSDGDGIADGYTTVTVGAGPYTGVVRESINESLDVVGTGYDANGQCALLWLHGPDGYTPVDLGSAFTTQQRQAFADDDDGDYHAVNACDINDWGQVLVREIWEDWTPNRIDPNQSPHVMEALTVITPRDVVLALSNSGENTSGTCPRSQTSACTRWDTPRNTV